MGCRPRPRPRDKERAPSADVPVSLADVGDPSLRAGDLRASPSREKRHVSVRCARPSLVAPGSTPRPSAGPVYLTRSPSPFLPPPIPTGRSTEDKRGDIGIRQGGQPLINATHARSALVPDDSARFFSSFLFSGPFIQMVPRGGEGCRFVASLSYPPFAGHFH